LTQTLFIPGPLPGLNEIIDAKARTSKTAGSGGRRWDAYSDMKRALGVKVMLVARARGFKKIEKPAIFMFEFLEPNRRRDPDNFVSGGKKVIFDALQEAGLLENDNWEWVKGFPCSWRVDKLAPGVILTVMEE
jgi:hypothetical protein